MNLFVQSIFKSVLISILILSCTERPVDAYVAYSEILKMHRKEVEFVDSESGVRAATIADFNNAGWYEVNGFSGNSFVGLNYDSINEEAYAGAKFGNIATSVEDVISGGDGEMVEDKFPLEFEND